MITIATITIDSGALFLALFITGLMITILILEWIDRLNKIHKKLDEVEKLIIKDELNDQT